MAIAIVDKIAVPLFFMVSGALLLGKDEPIRTLLVKRVARMVAVLAVFSTVYFALRIWGLVGNPLTLEFSEFFKSFVRGVFNGTIQGPLWFMYAYISFLLALPLLRAAAQNMQRNSWILLIVVSLLVWSFRLIGKLELGVAPHGHVTSALLNSIWGYPLMGYYLHNVVQTGSWKRIVTGWGCAVATVVISCWLIEKDIAGGAPPESATYLDFFAILLASCIFVATRWLFSYIPAGQTAIYRLRVLGSLTFGAYLLEGITREIFFERVFNFFAPHINDMVSTFIGVAVCMAVGLLFTWVLKRIPGIRYLL
jgi:surface polysaccharide O-acyltransferase-like enzyme